MHDVYLHVNLDGLDPEVAPGIVDNPVPGGLSLQDLEEATQAVADRFRIRAAALTTHNPELDEDEKTLRAGLRIHRALGGLRQRREANWTRARHVAPEDPAECRAVGHVVPESHHPSQIASRPARAGVRPTSGPVALSCSSQGETRKSR